uniref:Uncharacterized protein n=1 Tax=Tanacetum cinerariifolium TaxID=118510 RepID=A0A6L2NUP8_TANCI|nr:hypothetical protein [Tanacetum cinerariifolium]
MLQISVLTGKGLQFKQGWSSATTIKKKVILLDSALNLKGPRIRHGLKKKMLLTEALESGAYLDLAQLAFLADNGDTVTPILASQGIPFPIAFQTNDFDAFDLDCDDAPSAKAVLMANISSYDSNVLFDVPFHETNIVNYMSSQTRKNNSLDHDNFASGFLKDENDRLIELLIPKDILHIVVNYLAAINDYESKQKSFIDEYNETLMLQSELTKKHDKVKKAVYNELSK